MILLVLWGQLSGLNVNAAQLHLDTLDALIARIISLLTYLRTLL